MCRFLFEIVQNLRVFDMLAFEQCDSLEQEAIVPKTLKNQWFFNVFRISMLAHTWRHFGRILKILFKIVRHLQLRAKLMRIAHNLQKFVQIWSKLDALARNLVSLGRLLGSIWAFLGVTWGLLAASWAPLGRSWALLGCSWGRPGALLGAFWSDRASKASKS